MKIIPHGEAAARVDEVVACLAAGGLACVPVRGAYRMLADARSEDAIVKLAQSKRRVRARPALLVVSSLASARDLVDGTTWAATKKLAAKYWPGPLTLVLPPSKRLAPRIAKLLARSTGKLGIRVDDDPLIARIVAALGGPVMVSSANLDNKPGSSSAAAVRQRFERTLDIWVDAGDVRPSTPSTLVELTDTSWSIVRDGALDRAAIERTLGAAATS